MKKILPFATLIIFIVLGNLVTHAESISLTADVYDTTLTFSGYTVPNALVSFRENLSIIGTTTSNIDGSFSKSFPGISSGVHSIEIWASDVNSTTTLPVQFNLFLIDHQVLELGNVYLPPTIQLNLTAFGNADQLIISGFSKPVSQVQIDIQGTSVFTQIVNTDSLGYYFLNLNPEIFANGNHQLNSKLINLLLVSNDTTSSQLQFLIDNALSQITPLPSPVAITENVCEYSFARLCFFDSSKKGYIETTSDFNQFLNGFVNFFGKDFDISYDINQDGRVDASDLSVVLFYTKGSLYQINSFVPSKNIAGQNVEGISTENLPVTVSPQLLSYFTNFFIEELIIVSILTVMFIGTLVVKRHKHD